MSNEPWLTWYDMNGSLRVEGLGKRYRIGEFEPYGSLRERLSRWPAALLRRSCAPPEIRALQDVTFSASPGEVVGILGRNGAGKSTLLKILSRITEPSEGFAEIQGRVGSLLEVGTGFHPELTGRENIFLNGTLLGMSRLEIRTRFDAIVEFAGTERFLDTPVKRYSSGMATRLAFSVAAHLEPEILLVDEVLTVGDIAFQKRCLGKMDTLARSGRTVLLVSHNLTAVQHLCTRVLLFEDGRLVGDGNAAEVIRGYLDGLHRAAPVPLAERKDRQGSGRLRLTSLSWFSPDSGALAPLCGAPARLSLGYRGSALRDVRISVGLFTLKGEGALMLGSDLSGEPFSTLPEEGKLECRLDRLPLLPGTYTVNLYVTVQGEVADWVQDAGQLSVAEGDFFGTGQLPPAGYGSVAVAHAWKLST